MSSETILFPLAADKSDLMMLLIALVILAVLIILLFLLFPTSVALFLTAVIVIAL
jgi:hypothetical protein